MKSSTEAIIYLGEKRGCTQTDKYRSYHTFNFDSYHEPSRQPFGNIRAFNDETLGPSCVRKWQVGAGEAILLIPVIGSVAFQTNAADAGILEAGEIQLIAFEKPAAIELSNPFKAELINFLHVWFTPDTATAMGRTVNHIFDLDQRRNLMVPLLSLTGSMSVSVGIGKFDGRVDRVYSLENAQNGVFIFVVEGAFEVENRLLQQRDGLILWNTDKVEFESLSGDAIILIIETGSIRRTDLHLSTVL